MLRLRSAAIALFATLVLAGCTGPACDKPNVGAALVPRDAPSQGGTGTATARLEVRDGLTNEVIPGAAIAATWAAQVSETRGTKFTLAPFVVQAPTNEPVILVHTALRSDAAGAASVRAPAGAQLSLEVSASGYGAEFLHARADSGLAPQPIRLYPSEVTRTVTASWTGTDVTYAAIGGNSQTVAWRSDVMSWSDDAASNVQATRRLVGLQATLEWTQDPLQVARGDLGLALGTKADAIVHYTNRHDDTLANGVRREVVSLDLDDLVKLKAAGRDVLYFGPTYETLVAPKDALPYKMTVTGKFDAELLRGNYCGFEFPRVVASFSAAEFDAAVANGDIRFRDATPQDEKAAIQQAAETEPREQNEPPGQRGGTIDESARQKSAPVQPLASEFGGRATPAAIWLALAALALAAVVRRGRGQ